MSIADLLLLSCCTGVMTFASCLVGFACGLRHQRWRHEHGLD